MFLLSLIGFWANALVYSETTIANANNKLSNFFIRSVTSLLRFGSGKVLALYAIVPVSTQLIVPQIDSLIPTKSKLNRRRELLFLPGFGATVGCKDFLPQPDGLRCDLDVFIVSDEVKSLIKAERAVRNKADGLIGH